MKRKLLTLLCCVMLSALCVFTLTACGDSNGDNDGGLFHTHTYSSEWSYDDTHHFKKATCEHSTEVKDKQAHTMNGRDCTVCEYCDPSVGLEYELVYGQAYKVTGKGDCTDTDIIIPSIYEGKPVTSIDENAFFYCTSLTSVTIGNSVTSIGNDAFSYCTSLTSITLPNSITIIGNDAFEGCTLLTSIKLPNSLTSIDDGAFSNCTSLTSITLPNSITSISGMMFYECTSLTSVTIGNGVTSIGNYAFYGCTSLTSIIIPNSVTSISYNAFRDCTLLTIYSEATSQPSGWDSDWNYSNCPVYWYSESEPTSSGNYWHYVDGVVTKW